MDRSTIRESGSSDTNRPSPAHFDGTTRVQAMRELLAASCGNCHTQAVMWSHKNQRRECMTCGTPASDPTKNIPAHRFWGRERHTISGRQLMAQTEHAARVWEKLHPGKPAHFEMSGDDVAAVELRIWRHYAPWRMRARLWLSRAFRFAFLALMLSMARPSDACTVTAKKGQPPVVTNCQPPAPAVAADIVRPLQYVAPFVCDCDGPSVVASRYEGERYEIDFAHAADFRRRLDGWISDWPNFLGWLAPAGFPIMAGVRGDSGHYDNLRAVVVRHIEGTCFLLNTDGGIVLLPASTCQ